MNWNMRVYVYIRLIERNCMLDPYIKRDKKIMYPHSMKIQEKT